MTRYHNTNQLEGEALVAAKINAGKQEGRIIKLLRDAPYTWISARKLRDCILMDGKKIKLNSVRRSLSNLAEDGLAVKSCGVFPGKYTSVHRWQYAFGGEEL